MSLAAIGEAEVLDALRRCQPDTLTPIEAMSLIYELEAEAQLSTPAGQARAVCALCRGGPASRMSGARTSGASGRDRRIPRK